MSTRLSRESIKPHACTVKVLVWGFLYSRALYTSGKL